MYWNVNLGILKKVQPSQISTLQNDVDYENRCTYLVWVSEPFHIWSVVLEANIQILITRQLLHVDQDLNLFCEGTVGNQMQCVPHRSEVEHGTCYTDTVYRYCCRCDPVGSLESKVIVVFGVNLLDLDKRWTWEKKIDHNATLNCNPSIRSVKRNRLVEEWPSYPLKTVETPRPWLVQNQNRVQVSICKVDMCKHLIEVHSSWTKTIYSRFFVLSTFPSF